VLLRGWHGRLVTFVSEVGVASMVFGIARASSAFGLSDLQLHEHYVPVDFTIRNRCCVVVVS